MTSALRTRSNSPVDDAVQLGRRARDLAVDGTVQIAKRADVPHLVEVGRDTAAAAVSDAMDRVAGRRRHRRRNTLASVLAVGVLLTFGFAVWWFIRGSGSLAALRTIGDDDQALDDDLGATVDEALDAEAESRATSEGMGVAWASVETATIPVPPDGGPDEAADRAGVLGDALVGPA